MERESIESFTPENASKITGVPKEDIIKAALSLRRLKKGRDILYHGHHAAYPRNR